MTKEESLRILAGVLERIKNMTQEEFNIRSFLSVHETMEIRYREKIDLFLYQTRSK